MTARRTPPPLHRFIYVIGPATGLQKVGLATDPKVRLAALQTASPHRLVIHAAVQVPFGEAHAIERRAHDALASCRATGEWFDVAPAEAVAVVRSAAAACGQVPWPETKPLPLFAYTVTAPACRSSRAIRWRSLREVCLGIVGRRF